MVDSVLLLTVSVIAIALLFDFTNGFHDAANAIATVVSTRALTPKVALGMAACMNLVGSLLGTEVAKTIGSGIIDITTYARDNTDVLNQKQGLIIVLAGVLGAVVWNYVTWWFGLPSSSSHALIGGLLGAGLAASVTVKWQVVLDKVILPMFVSPVCGFLISFVVMQLVVSLVARRPYSSTMRGFRHLQILSASLMAIGHGLQDAQKTMGIIVMALVIAGYGNNLVDYSQGFELVIPFYVKLMAALSISLGTYSGGWRIIRTLGRKIIDLDPSRGFTAEMVSSLILYTTSYGFSAPISTTQTITSSIMGVGATKGGKAAIRWNVVANIVLAWVLTIPCASIAAFVAYWICHLLFY